MNILEAFKSRGEFEVNRSIGGIGGFVYIIAAPALVATGIIKGVTFTEFCLAFPAGLATVVGGTAGAVALKDRSVATSKIISDTGSAPGLAAPAPPAQPVPVVIQQPVDNPVPVTPQPEN